jgi:hypothetical protein
MSYQTGTWLPWFIKRFIFWKKDAELKPLYTFDRGVMRDIGQMKEEGEKERIRRESEAVVNGGKDGIAV